MPFPVACIQINSQNNMAHNLGRASQLIADAARQGAQFITLPENVAFMAKDAEELYANAYFPEHHPALSHFQACAKKHQVWLLVGSIPVKLTDSPKLANRSYLINSEGGIVCHYDKIHLFDVAITGGESHRESSRFQPGDQAVTALTPWGKIGLSICYDLRFPHLFRFLAKQGASYLAVPSAFTYVTGKAHWEILLRARAIENSCYIFAPAQTGTHFSKRKTYGHSLIIDPWGKVLANGKTKEGVIMATIDPSLPTTIRKQLPALEHDRRFR